MASISGRGNDARYGSGQYLTDISPEMVPCIRLRDMTPFQQKSTDNYYSLLRLKKMIMGTVSIDYVRYFIEFDVSSLTKITNCNEHIYLNPSEFDLDIQPLMIRWGATVG
jgi:HYD1 signature containing ADP-ribosyltransferase